MGIVDNMQCIMLMYNVFHRLIIICDYNVQYLSHKTQIQFVSGAKLRQPNSTTGAGAAMDGKNYSTAFPPHSPLMVMET